MDHIIDALDLAGLSYRMLNPNTVLTERWNSNGNMIVAVDDFTGEAHVIEIWDGNVGSTTVPVSTVETWITSQANL